MIKIKFSLFFLIIVLANSCAYHLPDAKLTPKKVCGQRICNPGNYGKIIQFYKKPLSPTVDSISTVKEVAAAYIGRTYPDKSFLREAFEKQIQPIVGKQLSENQQDFRDPFICSDVKKNPFSMSDILMLDSPEAREITYKKNKKLNIDVEIKVKNSMEEIKILNPLNTNLLAIEAKIRSAYSRINEEGVDVQAKYSAWTLNNSIIEDMTKNLGYLECKEYLKKHKQRIINVVGIVSFDVALENNNIDKITAELEADAKQYGIIGNLGAGFKREINVYIKTKIKNAHKVVVLRSIGYKDVDGIKRYNW